MQHEAHGPAGGGEDAPALEEPRQFIRVTVGQPDEHHVRLSVRVVHGKAIDGGQPGGECGGVGVVHGQPLDVVLERVNAGRGEDPRLAHAPAEHLAPAVRLLDERTTATQHRTARRAEAFRQAKRDRVEVPGDLGDRHHLLDRGVEHPGSVEMKGQTAAARQLGRLPEIVEREGKARSRVVQAQQARLRVVRVIVGLDQRFDALEIECAVGLEAEGLGLDAAEHRGSAALVPKGVAPLADDVLVPTLAVAENAEQISLRAARHEQGRLLAEHLRAQVLEAVDRRVLAIDVVTNLGCGHGGSHRRRGNGHGVAAQVDH